MSQEQLQKLAQGAEATIYANEQIIEKNRFEKKYRHPEIDKRLRKRRTKREAKVLKKLFEAGFPVPELIKADEKDMRIVLEKLPGQTVKEDIDSLENAGDKKYLKICKEIGHLVGKLHKLGIIHQDLTTSNMIYHERKKKVYLIDFGLSFFSEKPEDKSVDLHLLRRAVESRHHRIYKECFEQVIAGYKSECEDADIVLKRLEKVEKRGRNKGKK